MAIIIPDKNKLYIQPQYSMTTRGYETLRKIIEKINHNVEITTLITRSFGNAVKQYQNKFQRRNPQSKTINHFISHSERFKRKN